MKKAILFAAAIAAGSACSSARVWTLDECVEYAIENNIDVQTRRNNVLQSEIDVSDAKSRFLPQVSAYASQNFNFGRGLTAENTYANRNTSSFAAGAQLNMPLFQGLSAVRRLAYSRTALSMMLEQVEAAKDDVTLNVFGQYLQALYAKEMLQVAKANLDISTAELARRTALYEAGRLPGLDIYEARAQVSRDSLSLTEAVNDSVMAVLDLTQLLNLPTADDFEIEAVKADDNLLPLPEDVFANAMAFNHSIRAARLQQESAEKNVAVAKSGYLPTLNFSAGLGSNYYKTSGYVNESFGSQMRHNFAKSIGISLNVPLFDAFGTRNSVRRARAQQESARLQFDDSRNRLYKAIMQAHTQARGAAAKLASATQAVESSKAAFEAMRVKYDSGKANATEFETARQNYVSALAQSVQAKYEQILRVRILNFYNTSRLN